jgi:hypothetical protein
MNIQLGNFYKLPLKNLIELIFKNTVISFMMLVSIRIGNL